MQRNQSLSRREFLRLLAAGGAASLAACAPQPIPATPTAAASPTPAPTLPPTAIPTASLPPAPAPSPTPTVAATLAPGDLIKKVVVFIQENHTFDSLFAGFPGADGQDAGRPCPDALPADPPHQHLDALVADGATTAAARCSYAEAAAPAYWRLAREFTLCDRFFSESV